MYNVGLDENGFFTGSYAEVGKVDGGVDVETLPPEENATCHRLVDGKWVLSEEKINEINAEALTVAKAAKIEAINAECTNAIVSGIDVETSVGLEHFALTMTDQINITTLNNRIERGDTSVLYHADDTLCRNFTADEFTKIAKAAAEHIAYNTTLCNYIHRVVESCETMSELDAVIFNIDCLPDELLSSFNTTVSEF